MQFVIPATILTLLIGNVSDIYVMDFYVGQLCQILLDAPAYALMQQAKAALKMENSIWHKYHLCHQRRPWIFHN